MARAMMRGTPRAVKRCARSRAGALRSKEAKRSRRQRGDAPSHARGGVERVSFCRRTNGFRETEASVVWIWVLVSAVSGLTLLFLARRRRLAAIQPTEAARRSTIAELERGRFRVTGRVLPIETSRSGVDGAPCVFLERAEYRLVGSRLVPLLREVAHRTRAHPFWLDDGTGRLLVDPRHASIDAVTLEADEGLTAERRLRAGEEIELVACFERREHIAINEDGPYRSGATAWEAVDDPECPPQISYRTDASMVSAGDEAVGVLRGFGGLMMGVSAIIAAIGLLA
jgi:hypothetical protein